MPALESEEKSGSCQRTIDAVAEVSRRIGPGRYQFIERHLAEFTGGALVHILRTLHVDDEADENLIRACERALLCPDERNSADDDAAWLAGKLGYAYRRLHQRFDGYEEGDFVHDFLVNILAPALNGIDMNEYWVLTFRKKAANRIRDHYRAVNLKRFTRGTVDAARDAAAPVDAVALATPAATKVPYSGTGTLEPEHWTDDSLADVLGQRLNDEAVAKAVRRLPQKERRALELWLLEYQISSKHKHVRTIESVERVSRVTITKRINRAKELLLGDPVFRAALRDEEERRRKRPQVTTP